MSEDNHEEGIKKEEPEEQEGSADQSKDIVKKGEDEKIEGEILDGGNLTEMPVEIRRQVQAFSAMVQSQVRPLSNPLFEKFTPEHIDKYLDYIQRDDDHDHQIRKTNRWFYLFYFVFAIIIFGLAVVYLLPKDKEFLESLIQIIIILAGGIGAGYGLQEFRKK